MPPRILTNRLTRLPLLAALLCSAPLGAEPLAELLGDGAASAEAGRASQAAVDAIADDTRALLEEYRTVTRQLEGLALHNARLERQHQDQLRRLSELDAASAGAVALQREIAPLLLRMVDSLEQFVALDLPFRLPERRARLAALRAALDSAEVSIADAFRAVLDAYRAELDYARHLGTYRDAIDAGGRTRNVNVLHVGRTVLLAQTDDGASTLWWDPQAGAWSPLDEDYAAAVAEAIAIARDGRSPSLLRLPLPAPREVAP